MPRLCKLCGENIGPAVLENSSCPANHIVAINIGNGCAAAVAVGLRPFNEVEEWPKEHRMRCIQCGIPIPEPGEYPDPAAMLCDSCYSAQEGDK